MFEQAVLSSGPVSKRVWTTFAGVTGQALLVTFAVMIPMIWPEAMPSHQSLLRIFVPGVPPGPPPIGEAAAPRVMHAAPKPLDVKGLVIPTSAPAIPARIEDPPDAGLVRGTGSGVQGGSGPGVTGGVLTGMFNEGSIAALPPRPVEVRHEELTPAPAPTIQRYKEGGLVHLGRLVHRVEPIYPRLAVISHTAGVAELVGVVGIDGRIRELKLKTGHPLLAPAAIEAVRQWIYEPTTLNGDKVEIIAPITVTFRLN
jgi:periplasmic protein TonB